MTKLEWGVVGERRFELGVDRGVLYIEDNVVPWNGLISVAQSTDGGSPVPYYLDGVKYLNLASETEFTATIEAFTYPDEFSVCDGTVEVADGLFVTDQERVPFGLVYRTLLGNDIEGIEHGYKIHVIYNALAEPSEVEYASMGEEVEPLTFSWTISTKAEVVPGYKRTAHVIIDSTKVDSEHLGYIEEILYGANGSYPMVPSLPTIEQLMYYLSNPVPYNGIFDGGTPSEVSYRIRDGGSPTSIPVLFADGGIITVDADLVIVPYDAELEGGSPSSSRIYTLDGGTP